MMTAISGRGRYQGVIQVIQYNRHLYIGSLVLVAVALMMIYYLSSGWRTLLLIGVSMALFWTCSSILMSYYIYDLSPLYDLRWMNRCFSRVPRRWVNIHAGLDETSHLLSCLFSSSEGESLDIYDPGAMTELSITQARRIHPVGIQSRHASWSALPVADDLFDAAFLIFAAHELRRPEARVQLFRELSRVLCVGGEVVLVEHLRDWQNFLAFGPGFLHFLSRKVWRHAMDASGLNIRREISLTPFVRVFVLQKVAL